MTSPVSAAVDRARVDEIRAREESAYRARTPKSAALHQRARQALPLGVASSFQSYPPYPLFMTDARGSRINDADGNEYIYFDMAFGVLAAGHSHPVLVEALAHRIANGTCYTFPVEDGVVMAEAGVLAPEAFDPEPCLALMDRYGIHHAMVEMEPGSHRPT